MRARSIENVLTVVGAMPRMSTTSVEHVGIWSTCDGVPSGTGYRVAEASSTNELAPRRYAASVRRRSVELQPCTSALASAVEFEIVTAPPPTAHSGGGGGGGGGGEPEEPPEDPDDPPEDPDDPVEPVGDGGDVGGGEVGGGVVGGGGVGGGELGGGGTGGVGDDVGGLALGCPVPAPGSLAVTAGPLAAPIGAIAGTSGGRNGRNVDDGGPAACVIGVSALPRAAMDAGPPPAPNGSAERIEWGTPTAPLQRTAADAPPATTIPARPRAARPRMEALSRRVRIWPPPDRARFRKMFANDGGGAERPLPRVEDQQTTETIVPVPAWPGFPW